MSRNVRILRLLTLALTLAALLLPRVGGAAALLFTDINVVVICTGDRLQTISIDRDGTPVAPVEIKIEPCRAADIDHVAERTSPVAARIEPCFDWWFHLQEAQIQRPKTATSGAPTRGPPGGVIAPV